MRSFDVALVRETFHSRMRSEARCCERGVALTEFAILLPMMLTILLFTIWLWELSQVRLKLQEAARYAAWEATAYPQHDYEAGAAALWPRFLEMSGLITAEATVRYADMNSASLAPVTLGGQLKNNLMMAEWDLPAILVLDSPEEFIYSGPASNEFINIGDTVFRIVAPLIDLLSAWRYTNPNTVAESLIGTGGTTVGGIALGGAGAGRVFGQPHWGFNRGGYTRSVVTTYVKNEWFNVRLMGRPIFKGQSGVQLIEHYGLMTDAWKLQDGTDVAGSASGKGYWRQVQRMYLGTPQSQVVLATWVTTFLSLMTSTLASTNSLTYPPYLNPVTDFIKPVVVSKNYGGGALSSALPRMGKVTVYEEGSAAQYDTIPANKEYYKTLKNRGAYFMGCKEQQKLYCGATLGQDNPFGDFVSRQ